MKQHKSNLSRRFEDYAPKAPEGLLHDVKAEMERRQLSVGRPKLRENHLLMRRVALLAAAAAVALTLVMVWHSSDKATMPTLTADRGTMTEGQKTEEKKIADARPTADDVPGSATVLSGLSSRRNRPLRGQPETIELLAEAGHTVEQQTAVAQAPASETSAQKQGQPTTKRSARHDDDAYDETRDIADFGNIRHNASRLTLSAYYGSGGSDMHGNAQGVVMAAAATFGENADFLDLQNAKMTYGSPSRVTANMKHHRPVRAGVSIRWQLSRRWGIGSGLTYSYLRSDYSGRDARGETTGEQHLHYIGIPLNVDYSIWQSRHVRVYLTGGGEAQKLVSGHSNESSTDGSESSYKVKESQMQWSAQMTVGGEYHLLPGLGVYVEPGVDHHFKNGSSVDNYYKHKPTSFSLNVGLRWNFE